MWKKLIREEENQTYFKKMLDKIEQSELPVYPERENWFTAFELTPFDAVKVVILGQDPYHQPGQAMGLSFSVNPGVKLPKSLINIYKELESDLGINKVTGDLSGWAKQGVFLLNTILTVEDSQPLSHQDFGWEIFTDKVFKLLGERKEPIVFVLWGKEAQKKASMIKEHHRIIKAPHPSPLSSYRGFFGSKPFSQINQQLETWGYSPIDWSK